MKNQLTVFPAIFTFDGKYYNVDFIDLKGCSTFGSSIQDAYSMAQDAMGLYLDNMTNFPNPSLDFSNIRCCRSPAISPPRLPRSSSCRPLTAPFRLSCTWATTSSSARGRRVRCATSTRGRPWAAPACRRTT